tara:strand:+ start:300 stop:734 length:435 start_codon:yes stop_codon:yes gene_type:complete
MTYRKLFPAIGLLEKANPSSPESLQNQNINNISMIDNSNSTESNNLQFKNKNALVYAQFSREDEKSSSSTISILVGDSDDETRIARIIGDQDGSIQYRYASSSVAIDTISESNGLNIRKYYTNSNTDTIDYGDGTYIFILRTST